MMSTKIAINVVPVIHVVQSGKILNSIKFVYRVTFVTCPAFMRFCAMGEPIIPRPRKPMLAGVSSAANKLKHQSDKMQHLNFLSVVK